MIVVGGCYKYASTPWKCKKCGRGINASQNGRHLSFGNEILSNIPERYAITTP